MLKKSKYSAALGILKHGMKRLRQDTQGKEMYRHVAVRRGTENRHQKNSCIRRAVEKGERAMRHLESQPTTTWKLQRWRIRVAARAARPQQENQNIY
jgi:hypothetical protein